MKLLLQTQAEPHPSTEVCQPVLRPKLTSPAAAELATTFKALADTTRVQIVSLLLEAGPEGFCVCDIMANFPLAQPTISHHLKVLRDAALVHATKKGLWVYYSVDRDRLARQGIAIAGPSEPSQPSVSSAHRSRPGAEGDPEEAGRQSCCS